SFGLLAEPIECTPIVLDNEFGYRWSGVRVTGFGLSSPPDGIDDRVMFAERGDPQVAAQVVAEAMHEHDRAVCGASVRDARAVLDVRPLRIAGARPIPHEPDAPPHTQLPARTLAGRGRKRGRR